MIEVIVRCVPHGEEADAFVALRLVVINSADHAKRPEVGNYVIRAYDADGVASALAPIKGHVRAHGLPSLLRKALARVPTTGFRSWPSAWAPATLRALCDEILSKGTNP